MPDTSHLPALLAVRIGGPKNHIFYCKISHMSWGNVCESIGPGIERVFTLFYPTHIIHLLFLLA